MQKGHDEELLLGFSGDLDLKSEGRLARAGEKMTHWFVTGSFRSSGLRVGGVVAMIFDFSFLIVWKFTLPFFASRIKLGRNGVEALIPSDLIGLSEYEGKMLEALKPELKASIEKGIAFVQKQPVTA